MTMSRRAAYVSTPSVEDPANAVEVGDLDVPEVPDGWSRVDVHAGALNMHDIWMLRGVAAVSGEGPLVLGSDGAGTCEGRDVLIYPVLPSPGVAVAHSVLLSDRGHGLLAEQAVVPAASLVPKPPHLTWEEAAGIPTAWLTAYRMLFTKARIQAGQVVLVQGAGGGVSTAVIALAKAAGASVIITSRTAAKRERALGAGADVALGTDERVPELVDAVIESVGPATFEHSVKSTRAGGTIVVCGASTGFTTPLNLARLFAREITIHGSTMGTLEEFTALAGYIGRHRIRPTIDGSVDLGDVRTSVKRILDGDAFGKLCVVCAGADLTEGRSLLGDAAALLMFLDRGRALVRRLRSVQKPTIAAVNGAAYGGGLELLLACDIAVAARSARIGDPHVAVGQVPGWGSSVMLPQAVGPVLARRLLITGESWSADEAARRGLVSEVVDDSELDDHAAAIAGRVAELDASAVTRMLGVARPLDAEDAWTREAGVLQRHIEGQIQGR